MQNTIEKINHMVRNYKLDDPAKTAEIMVTNEDLLIELNQLLGQLVVSEGFESEHIKIIITEKIVDMIENINDRNKVINLWRVVKSLIAGFFNDYV